MNPTMKAIKASNDKLRRKFITTSIRTPRKTFSDEGWTSTGGFSVTVDELYEGAPRYTGKVEKIGNQTPILEYIKQQEKKEKEKTIVKTLKKY